MVASKKAIEDVQLSTLKESDYPVTGFEVLSVTVQPVNRKRLILEGQPEEAAKKLVEALRQEGVL
jgi:electron transfer flavoprotein alpha/beta subunit